MIFTALEQEQFFKLGKLNSQHKIGQIIKKKNN